MLGPCETHLWVTRRCKDVLRLGFARELLREDLTLNVGVGADVANRKCDALAHNLSVQILALNLLLDFT